MATYKQCDRCTQLVPLNQVKHEDYDDSWSKVSITLDTLSFHYELCIGCTKDLRNVFIKNMDVKQRAK